MYFQKLQWELSPPTAIQWLNLYLQAAQLPLTTDFILPSYPQETFVQIAQVRIFYFPLWVTICDSSIMSRNGWVTILNWYLWCSLAVGSLHDGHWVIEICSICPCSSLPIPFQFRRFGSRMFRIQTSRNLARYQVCPIYPHKPPRTGFLTVCAGRVRV